MADITNVIRWNANFVRGLAQSVLERARVIRGTLTAPAQKRAKKKVIKRTVRRARSPRKPNVG